MTKHRSALEEMGKHCSAKAVRLPLKEEILMMFLYKNDALFMNFD